MASENPLPKPLSPTLLGTLSHAQVSFDLGRTPVARQMAEGILRQEPEHIGALELLAKIQWRQTELRPLLRTLRLLIGINPYEPGYHYLEGAALHCLGHYGEALKAYTRSREISPECRHPEAEAAIAALQECQLALLAELLKDDAGFRLRYAQDPQAACDTVGIRFSEEEGNQPRYPAASLAGVAAWIRPS